MIIQSWTCISRCASDLTVSTCYSDAHRHSISPRWANRPGLLLLGLAQLCKASKDRRLTNYNDYYNFKK